MPPLAVVLVSVACAAASAGSQAPIDEGAIERDALTVPEAVWTMLDDRLGLGGQPLGYTAEQMANFGRDAHLLRPVLRQFRDVRSTVRFSGRTTGLLLDNSAYEDELIRHAFAEYLDEHVGRRVRLDGLDGSGVSGELPGRFDPATESGGWSVAWLRDAAGEDLSLDRALGVAIERFGPSWSDDERGRALQAEVLALLMAEVPEAAERLEREAALRDRFADDDLSELPAPAKRLIVRLLVAAAEAEPWVANAIDREAWETAALRDDERRGWRPSAYDKARAVRDWDGPAPLTRSIFELVGDTDLSPLGHASVVTAKRVRLAIAEYERAMTDEMSGSAALRELNVTIPVGGTGRIVLAGAADSTHESSHADAPILTLDFGGDDDYRGAFAVSDATADRPVSLLIDLAGDDRYGYEPVESPAPTLATGLLGIGMLWDLGGGDDAYAAGASSLGAAWHGVGVLIDDGGDDAYTIDDRWGQGMAHVGFGALIDRGGDDVYSSGPYAQGHGSTRGAGVLVDVAGDDRYVIRDDAEPSELYLGRTVAMGQGCGYGRRADLGDGESMAGGFGVLVDGAGDDSYSAMAWAQGAAYWWGVGILEDRGGADVYRQGKYAQGAAAHFGVGVFVDLRGDDRYNTARERMLNPFTGDEQLVAENQYAGHARDGGIGICIDAAGDDVHVLRANSGGNADLNSVGFFWDRSGDDRYEGLEIAVAPSNPSWERPPLGSVTRYPAFNSFRDELPSFGVFLDTSGDDSYVNVGRERRNDHHETDAPTEREAAVFIDGELLDG